MPPLKKPASPVPLKPYSKQHVLQLIYLYLISFVGIVITVVSSVNIVNLVFRHYIFQADTLSYYYAPDICNPGPAPLDKGISSPVMSDQERENCEKRELERVEKQQNNDIKRELASGIAGLVVGGPLWLYHWGIIRKRKEEEMG